MLVTTTCNGVEAEVSVAGDVESVSFRGSSGLIVPINAHHSADRFAPLRGNRIVDRLTSLTGLDVLYGETEPA